MRAASVAVRRAALAVALILFAGLLLRDVWLLGRYAAAALVYPYDLDYGEGIVWQQAREIVGGRGYAPLGVYPAIVFHYPPVYHLIVMGVAGIGGIDPLAAGRGVSIAATLVTMALCAVLAARLIPPDTRRWTRLPAAIGSALIFAVFAPVAMWFAFMRVDMLAGALSLGGLLVAVRAARHPRAVLPAAILFVLAIYTKQTSVAAPAAAILMLGLARPRAAIALALACGLLGSVALGLLEATTRGGFLRHIVGYNLNRFDASNAVMLLDVLRAHLVVFGLAAIGVWRTARPLARAGLRSRVADDPRAAAALAALLFLAIRTAMLPMILKSGSSFNYLIEWLSIVAVFTAPGLALLATGVAAAPSPVMIAAAALLPLQVAHMPRWDLTAASGRAQAARLAPLMARIRAAPRPVIGDAMVLLIRAGRPVAWEPAITAELGAAGRYDAPGFARLVRAHRFAFFVTRGARGTPLFDDRYGPVVADAIDAAYPRKTRVGGLVLHLPADAAIRP